MTKNKGEYCHYCGTLYPEAIKADQAQRAAPIGSLDSKYHVENTQEGLVIWWNWRSLSVWFFFVTILVWNVIAWRMENGLITLIGMGLIAWIIIILLNKTRIHVTTNGISVQHRPVPCRRGYQFNAVDIQQLYVSREQKRAKDRTWHAPALQLITQNGQRHTILNGTAESEFADFETLRRKILSQLGIEPRHALGQTMR
ncbi:MAG: hypothetical protein AB8B87_24135 [Granulosicoccus sp.]